MDAAPAVPAPTPAASAPPAATGPALLASGGEIHVTLAHGPPYDSWDCVLIAKLAGLRVRRCVPFEAARFAGYAHRRTLGDDHPHTVASLSNLATVYQAMGQGERAAAMQLLVKQLKTTWEAKQKAGGKKR